MRQFGFTKDRGYIETYLNLLQGHAFFFGWPQAKDFPPEKSIRSEKRSFYFIIINK